MKKWRFWLGTAAALLGMAATASLGFWQWGRAQQRTALHEAIVARQSAPPLDAASLVAAAQPESLMHRTVRLRGHWVGAHTVFLDNRQMEGRPGFYVVTPLRLEGSGAVVLVQRGWAPRNFERREQLPAVETPAGEVLVEGRLAPPPAKLYELGQGSSGPIRQNLDLALFREETRLPLLPLSVLQAGLPSEGLQRRWPEVASGADKNRGYAFQWWALAGLIAFLYAWFQFIVPRKARAPR